MRSIEVNYFHDLNHSIRAFVISLQILIVLFKLLTLSRFTGDNSFMILVFMSNILSSVLGHANVDVI